METLRQSLIRSLAENGVKPVLARDLGNGPHRPFGSALQGVHGNDPLATPELVGRTRKPRSAGACKVCGERTWFCDCEEAA